MTIKELITKLGFEVDEKPLNKAESALEGIKHAMEALIAIELGKQLFELTERFAHWGEEIKVMSENVGMSVENFQAMAFAASQADVSTEELGHGMAILSRRIYEARTGSKEASDAFRKAGISPEQIKSFTSADQALLALSDRMRAMPDQFKKSGAAMELMGRGGYQMIAFLSKGSQAIRQQMQDAKNLGLILSGPQIEALENVEHAFQRMYAIMRAIGALVASEVAPLFIYLVDQFTKLFNSQKDIIHAGLKEFLDVLVIHIAMLAGFVAGLTHRFIEWYGQIKDRKDLINFIFTILEIVAALKILLFFIGLVPTMVYKGIGQAFLWLARTVLLPLVGIVWDLVAAFAATPLGLITLAVVALHDLYTMIFGSGKWEDTWLSKALGGIGSALGFLGKGAMSAGSGMVSGYNALEASRQNGIDQNLGQGRYSPAYYQAFGNDSNSSVFSPQITIQTNGSLPGAIEDSIVSTLNKWWNEKQARPTGRAPQFIAK